MSRIIRRRPSPSMIVAGAALVVALAGTAIAGPLATKSALTGAEKKQTKKIAKSAIKKAGLKTSSAFNENTSVVNLSTSFVPVVSATIKTHSSGRILATGSADLVGATADELGECRIQIDGANGGHYATAPDDIGTFNYFVIAVSFAVTRPAGTYTASLQCRAVVGSVDKDVAAINVYGLDA